MVLTAAHLMRGPSVWRALISEGEGLRCARVLGVSLLVWVCGANGAGCCARCLGGRHHEAVGVPRIKKMGPKAAAGQSDGAGLAHQTHGDCRHFFLWLTREVGCSRRHGGVGRALAVDGGEERQARRERHGRGRARSRAREQHTDHKQTAGHSVRHSFECNRHFPCNCPAKWPSNRCCRKATVTTVNFVTTKVLYELKRSAGSGRAGSKNTEHVGAGCWWNGEVLQDRNPSTRTLPRAIEFGILQEETLCGSSN